MSDGLIEITEKLKEEYEDRLSKIVGFGSKISDIKCNFCGSPVDKVKLMIAGDRVYICDDCVRTCNGIINEKSKDSE